MQDPESTFQELLPAVQQPQARQRAKASRPPELPGILQPRRYVDASSLVGMPGYL